MVLTDICRIHILNLLYPYYGTLIFNNIIGYE